MPVWQCGAWSSCALMRQQKRLLGVWLQAAQAPAVGGNTAHRDIVEGSVHISTMVSTTHASDRNANFGHHPSFTCTFCCPLRVAGGLTHHGMPLWITPAMWAS